VSRWPPAVLPGPVPDVAALFGSTAQWALSDDVAHTNHGSFGGMTTATARAVASARRRVAANPMRAFTREFDAAHARAVAAVASLVGARPGDTTLVPNATTGMDVAMRLLPWEPDATIVVADQAYPSVLANLRRRAARSGARLRVVATDPRDPAGCGQALVAAMDEAAPGRTGVVVDQVASATACPFPVDEVVAAARARNVVVVVDGAHVPGQFAPAAATPGADAWTGNLHKWACAPIPLAALVVDERHHATIGPVVPTWLDDADFPANSAWQGTMDPGPLLVAEQVVAQALAILAHTDHIEDLAVAGAAHLAAAVGGHVLPGTGWMRAVVLPRSILRAPAVAAAAAGPAPASGLASPLDLAARAVEAAAVAHGVEAKVTPFREDLVLRLSCHAYTSARDHDRLAEVLVELVAMA
jgi:isopenicillin-N epimerase